MRRLGRYGTLRWRPEEFENSAVGRMKARGGCRRLGFVPPIVPHPNSCSKRVGGSGAKWSKRMQQPTRAGPLRHGCGGSSGSRRQHSQACVRTTALQRFLPLGVRICREPGRWRVPNRLVSLCPDQGRVDRALPVAFRPARGWPKSRRRRQVVAQIVLANIRCKAAARSSSE